MNFLLYLIFALSISVLLNFIFSKFWKFDFLKSVIKSDRWGETSVPIAGGIVVFIIFVTFSIWKIGDFSRSIFVAFAGGLLIFILGLIDDIFNLKSSHKFLGQIVIILFVVSYGVRATLFGSYISLVVTILWILGITNAFNLLDNMDGLAAGIAIISALFLGIHFATDTNTLLGYFSFLLMAILIGFLFFNFNPAKIFLGDSGALFIGYFLAVLTILGSQKSGVSLFITIIFPIMIMLIPIFDTMLVSVTRQIRSTSPFKGGKDHLSHRLVILGMSEKGAVLSLYSVSLILGFSAFALKGISLIFSVIIYFFVGLIVILFGVYIGTIKISPEAQKKENIVVVKSDFFLTKRIFSILVDLILLAFIYYFSYQLSFKLLDQTINFRLFLISLPILLSLKIIFLAYFNVYQINLKYFSISDIIKIIKGISLASVLTIIILTFIMRFMGYSRVFFIIDWIFSLLVIGSLRVFFRVFDEIFYPLRAKQHKQIVVVGDMEMFQAISKYLQIRSHLNFSVLKHFSVKEFNKDKFAEFIQEKGADISMVLFEDKKLTSQAQIDKSMGKNIIVVNEKEFFMKIME